MMLEDEGLLSAFEMEIKNELINAEQVAKNIFRKYINKFKDSPAEMVRTKANDLRDILRKVLRDLLGIERSVLVNLPPESIIVTRRLLPSDTLRMDQDNEKGILGPGEEYSFPQRFIGPFPGNPGPDLRGRALNRESTPSVSPLYVSPT